MYVWLVHLYIELGGRKISQVKCVKEMRIVSLALRAVEKRHSSQHWCFQMFIFSRSGMSITLWWAFVNMQSTYSSVIYRVKHAEYFVFSRSIHLQGIQHRVFLHCATCRIFFFQRAPYTAWPACSLFCFYSVPYSVSIVEYCAFQSVGCSVLCCYRVQHPASTMQSFFVFASCSKQWVPFAKHAAFLVCCTAFSFLPAKGIPSIQFYLHFSKQREEKIRLERGKLN
jgi:hypothetical protein